MKHFYRFIIRGFFFFLLVLSFVSTTAFGQIAAWNLTSTTTSATTADANLSASAISVVPTTAIAYQPSPGDIYCGSWSTSATFSTSGKYWEFSITPNPGFEITLSSVTFKAGRTSAGPQKIQVQYSLDAFATAGVTALGETANSNTSSLDQFTLTALPATTSNSVTFRIWGYGASGTGNFRLNNIVVNGTVTSNAIPGSGIGTAQIFPTYLNANQTTDFSIKVASNATDTISNVVVIVPSAFNWSMNANDVSFGTSFSGANLTVVQDTITFSHAVVTDTDTGSIVIHSVTVPDSSMTGIFVVKTSIDTVAPSPVNSKLAVNVIKVTPIVQLHINDSQGVPIAPYQVGATVTVSGIVTADFSTLPQTNLFIQDTTGGVNIFSYSHSYNYLVGDSITFTGTIQQFRGTVEIVPDSAKTIIHSHNNPMPEPLLLTCADVNQTFNDDYSEPNEGRLVRINSVTYDGANNTITDVTGTTGGFIPVPPLVAPAGTFDLIGILKQYKPGIVSTMTPPYTSDYEVQARFQSDILTSAGPAFTSAPTEGNIQSNSVSIFFKTSRASSAVIRYGTSTAYSDSVIVSSTDTVHTVALNGLWPSTVYHYQVSATDTGGTNTTGDAIFSTASPSTSSGVINVYFNHAVDPSVAVVETAQTVNIVDKFIARIHAAQYSIDYAFYSLSGTVGANIASALLDARNRGVKVRLITEYDNSNTAPQNTLKNSGIPYITDKFDPINNGNGLMHNKFAVFDYRDTSSASDDWVWTGSWNATDPGNNNDAQNALEIQDKSLAQAYTMEFNEMWGSDTDTPNANVSRFGARKLDNTPHKFNIKGTPVNLYFSPSDQTTYHIYENLVAATYSINVAMYTFTRSDLAQELVAQKNAGRKVRVLMDNNTDTGNQYSFLQSNGIDLHLKGSDVTGLLHHKYAIVDGEAPSADEIVLTGSSNWSNADETQNNENMIVFHSKRIANLYLQEYKARYIAAGGTDNIVLGVKQVSSEIPLTTELQQNYPNPFNPSTHFRFSIANAGLVSLKIYDVLGREVATLVNEKKSPGTYEVQWNASNTASGVYFYRLKAGNYTQSKRMLLLK